MLVQKQSVIKSSGKKSYINSWTVTATPPSTFQEDFEISPPCTTYLFMRSLCVCVFSPTTWCRHVCLLPWKGMRRMFTESPWLLWSPPLLTDLRCTWTPASWKFAHTHTHTHDNHWQSKQRRHVYCTCTWATLKKWMDYLLLEFNY